MLYKPTFIVSFPSVNYINRLLSVYILRLLRKVPNGCPFSMSINIFKKILVFATLKNTKIIQKG